MNTYNVYIYSSESIDNEKVKKNIERYGREYSFTKLTNEHLTKLLLLQKINKTANRYTIINIILEEDIDIDDLKNDLHPKLYTILKYHLNDYGIFIKK
jgi:hypothetical protein